MRANSRADADVRRYSSAPHLVANYAANYAANRAAAHADKCITKPSISIAADGLFDGDEESYDERDDDQSFAGEGFAPQVRPIDERPAADLFDHPVK